MMDYQAFFKTATGYTPYGFQVRFAEQEVLKPCVRIPTGLGKTAMVIVGWLWRRQQGNGLRSTTPRRLVYCLPMRVLVEQTYDAACEWVSALRNQGVLPEDVPVHLLMGGEVDRDWTLYPERDAILIGTQDMLLSRALNRGYASSRSRWPVEFGLLHNDCLWVFDEVQLMGSGMVTTSQLEAFRSRDQTWLPTRTIWMSATMAPEWLHTVDYTPCTEEVFELTSSNAEHLETQVSQLLQAEKRLSVAEPKADDPASCARAIAQAHVQGSLTLVICNTVRRAVALHKAIEKAHGKNVPPLLLLHSRFRPGERKRQVDQLLEMERTGGIAVCTQVVEAGVDVSARVLFTELAPWASLVQRFGRCNRRAQYPDATVHWIDLETGKLAEPYTRGELDAARERLRHSDGSVAPGRLTDSGDAPSHGFVLRHKDLLELFDTTPDLAGCDVDVSRYIRDTQDHDVHVLWRDGTGQWTPETVVPAPERQELCPVPVSELRDFWKKHSGQVFRWDFLDGRWVRITDRQLIYPGQTYVIDASAGGYTATSGWDGISREKVAEALCTQGGQPDLSQDSDPLSVHSKWLSIAEHTNHVCEELERLVRCITLGQDSLDVLRQAARWHDRGKAHEVFQAALPDDKPPSGGPWAKAPGKFKPYQRRHFRHELASALAALQSGLNDLAIYLVAAHHGKVRLSIRSLPDEEPPPGRTTDRFARGIWDKDCLPRTDLGGGTIAPEVLLNMEPMELGFSQDGQASWLDRTLLQLENQGPFRLAFLEAILRAADCRASVAEQNGNAEVGHV